VIQIAVLSIQSDARNFPSFGIKAKNYHPTRVILDTTTTILNVPKGGSDGSDNKAVVVGVIDLRPDESSSVFGNNNNTLCDAILVSNSIGTFPVSNLKEEEEEKYDKDYDHIMNLQSAAAETIGTFCDSICLFVSYDPKEGKTILHRTAGVKLAGVVNGMRQQQQQQSGSSVPSETTTRLTLFLFCIGDKPNTDDDWDPKGAEHLVDKLKTFFTMGIDNNNNNNVTNASGTFENIDIVPLWKLPNNSNEEAAYQQVFSNNKLMTKAITTDIITSRIQHSYDKMGGKNQILYDDVVLERK